MKIKQVAFKFQRGVALITVLFLFALATVIVSGLVILQNSNVQRASAVLESEQASLLCLSGEEWARQFLAEDYKIDQNVDHVHEKWAEDGKILEIENGYIEVSIVDAQAKFDINNLIDGAGVTNPAVKAAFQRLVNSAVQDQQISSAIADQAADWMDADPNGIEEADYLSEAIPYRPPNTRIADVSELRLLKDMDRKTYKTLRQEVFPYLTALPATKPISININTAYPLVLAASANISMQEAESLVKEIQSNQNGSPIPGNLQQISPHATTYSEYFEVRIRARFADHYSFMTSVIFRDHNTGEMQVISRDRSERFIFPFSKDYKEDANSKDYEIDI